MLQGSAQMMTSYAAANERLAGSRIGIPGNSRKKLLSALLLPQETLTGTGRWPAALARAANWRPRTDGQFKEKKEK